MCGTEARQGITTGGYTVVAQSAFAVHFARRAGFASSPAAALQGFAEHGVRCDVIWRTEDIYPKQLHTSANQLLGGRPIGIGVLQPSTGPTLEDYKVYEHVRQTFLRGPAGAVALLRGGILWRLTIGSRGLPTSIPDMVCYRNGDPSLVTINTVDNYSDVHRILSTQEEYIICGVYRVLTRKSTLNLSSDRLVTLHYIVQRNRSGRAGVRNIQTVQRCRGGPCQKHGRSLPCILVFGVNKRSSGSRPG